MSPPASTQTIIQVLASQLATRAPARRLEPGDLAELKPAVASPLPDAAAKPVAPPQDDARPLRPGSRLDIRV